MPDLRWDPLDLLRAPVVPVAPDSAFAEDLRERLTQAVLAAIPAIPSTRSLSPTSEEPAMSTHLSSRPRNGTRHGDISYITLGLPDVARARAFYSAVLGWRFSPGSSEHGAQVDDTVPMIGLWDGEQPAGDSVHGAVLGFRVDDIAAAVAAVRAHGGTINDPHQEPYGLAAEGADDQGIPIYLHQMPQVDDDSTPSDTEFHNGEVEGDVSYLTMVTPDVQAAHAFYGGVLGWTFNIGRAGGAQVTGVAPQIGLTSQPEAGPVTPGVILCYRVDDIAASTARVLEAGGQAHETVQRPYGLEALCSDDQGTPFYLHQFGP
jgi:predicted enzyme related to lactoylglutathione lyase